jgi:hypothetical protein
MCGTITSNQRCYCYQHTYRQAGRHFAYDGDTAGGRVVFVLAGLVLFLIDLNVTNHGLPTAGASWRPSSEAWPSSGRAFRTLGC